MIRLLEHAFRHAVARPFAVAAATLVLATGVVAVAVTPSAETGSSVRSEGLAAPTTSDGRTPTSSFSNADSTSSTSGAGVASRSTGTSRTSSGMAPCPSPTATGCDRSGDRRGNGGRACEGTGPGTITASPIAFAELSVIQPMGLAIGGHVTPIDHGYFYIKGSFDDPPKTAAVYAPLDGILSEVSRTSRAGDPNVAGSPSYDDYALSIEATCTFRVRFSNLLRLDGRLGAAVGQLAPNERKVANLKVKAGELLGYTGMPTAHGIDVWVEDDTTTLTGFVKPEQYTSVESWKLHMVDLFEHTREPLRSQLLALVERDAEPRWGKIDQDIDGRLVGSWFREGSGGYGGNARGGEGYWDGHLSVVYQGNDPNQVIVSFGNYQGKPWQFAVLGNGPDPAGVSPATGLVKYELGQIELYSADTGQVWNARDGYLSHLRARAIGPATGTVLLQLTGERTLKMQTFPGKTADQVAGFDAGALVYTR